MLTVRRPFRLDKTNGKIMGVCAGIAAYFGFEAIWARLAFVAASLLGFGSPILIYLVIGLVADRKAAL
jgi:phage shock protein PspC (stress-responsive transcriptional regulator)